MAWCPFAQKLELQPESDSQPAIRPTQFIMHSIAAPWDEQRIYEYWRDSTNLESHFGLDYDGSMGQFIGTQTRADANYRANLRPDGTGAVSVETASNLKHTDPWTPEQIEALIRLGVWLHQQHGIPLRICQAWDDPGYGYHRLYPEWSSGGTDCPGDARVRQFREVVFPGIVARATGTTPPTQETDMTIQKIDEANAFDVDLADNVWTTLAFTDAVIHSGPRQLVGPTYVQLTFEAGATGLIAGRFVLTNPDGSGTSGYGDIGEFPASSVPQFLHNHDIPANKTLRFQVKARTGDGSTTKLIHRVVSGDFTI